MSQHGREPPPYAGEARTDRRAAAPTLIERMRALFGLQAGSLREDLEDAIEESGTSDVFTPQERAMLRNVLDLHEIRVEDVMVPRADIIAVALDDSLGEVLTRFREAGHSRLPVHGATLDEPKGMVHIRDFVQHITEPALAEIGRTSETTLHFDMRQSLEASGVMRTVLFVPPSMQAIDLLVRMQTTRTHMALVIDEFGGTDGLVTIEDIVEMIVGDIEDEHDEDERPKITDNGDGSFTADARATLDDLGDALGLRLAPDDEAEEVDTLGGLVTSLAGHVPATGELVSGHAGVDFEIIDADPRRVKSVRLRPVRQAGDPVGSEPRTAGTSTEAEPD